MARLVSHHDCRNLELNFRLRHFVVGWLDIETLSSGSGPGGWFQSTSGVLLRNRIVPNSVNLHRTND